MPSAGQVGNTHPDRPAGRPRACLLNSVGLGVALLLFCVLALWQLELPGMYQDEAYDAAPAVYLLTGTGSWPYAFLPGTLDLPLMVCDHVGPTSTYLMIPFLRVWGIGPRAVRLYEFACGLAAVILIFLWARRVVAPGFAGVAAILAAATPSLWLASRNGLHVSFIVVPLAAGALICFDRWYRDRGLWWLLAGCFLCGVGLSTKILFVWFIGAVAVGVLATQRMGLVRLRTRQLLLGGASFAIGLGPFLIFNVLSRGQTFRTVFSAAGQTPYGVRNTDVLANLRTQLNSFAALLGGSWLDWTGETPHNPIALILFGAAAACILARWRSADRRRALLCLIAVALMLAASCFTISTLHPKHLVIVLPFVPVIVAAALGLAYAERSRPASVAALAVLAALCTLQLGWDLRNSARYHRSLAATGGVGLFSSAHNELADYLIANDVARPLAGDWGFQDNLTVLSAGRIATRQIFELTEEPPHPFTREQARLTLGDPSSVYLFHDEAIAAAPERFAAFQEVADELGVDIGLAATFTDGWGDPVIHVYRAGGPAPEQASTAPDRMLGLAR